MSSMAPHSVRFGQIAEVKQRWSVIGWMTKNLLSRVKSLVPAAFAVVSNPHWASVVGYGPFSLCVIHKEGMCWGRGDINRLLIKITYIMFYITYPSYFTYTFLVPIH
jgi:hypothetical protein